MERQETLAPWLTFRYLWTDRWTRVLGRMAVAYECLICGERWRFIQRIPRFGPVPEPEGGGMHPERRRIIARHAHPGDRGNPLAWALPLGNIDALSGTDYSALDVLAEAVRRGQP
jgi:hypothetical protein